MRLLQVPDLFLLQLAAHKALESERMQRRTTRSLHTELVFNMSGSKHVSIVYALRALPASPYAHDAGSRVPEEVWDIR
jgi:hypothetical protein